LQQAHAVLQPSEIIDGTNPSQEFLPVISEHLVEESLATDEEQEAEIQSPLSRNEIEGSELKTTESGRTMSRKRMAIISVGIVLLGAGVAAAVLCGTGNCGGGDDPQLLTEPTEAPAPPTLEMTPLPTPEPTLSPTAAPTPMPKLETRNELLVAVDNYLAAENPETSNVAEKYGYPIGTWDVSGITDFARTFDGVRNGACRSFNEDLSRWNVSSATSMRRMFWEAEACKY
jgi:surface protein